MPRCFCWPKGTSLECAESIYVKTTETACVSDELCRFKEEEEEEEEGEPTNREFRRFAYKACTGSFSYFKHTNS